MREILVAIGIVYRAGRVLICRRRADDSFANLWEFPGGKCEAAETPRACVVRELAEELDVVVTPLEALAPIRHQYSAVRVTLHPFICRLESGEAKALSAAELAWVLPTELASHEFPAANAELIRELASRTWNEGE